MTRPRVGLAAAALILLALAVVLQGGVTPVGAVILNLGVAALAAVAAGCVSIRGVPPAALMIAGAWCLLAMMQIGWALDTDAALDGAASVVATVALFLVAASSYSEKSGWRFFSGIAVLGAAVASLAVIAGESGTRAAFPLGNPNHLAGWLLLPGGIALAGLLFGHPRYSVGWFGMVVVIGAGIAASGSRGATLAAGVACLGVVMLRRASKRSAFTRLVAGFAAAGLALAVLPAIRPDWVPAVGAGGVRSAGLRWTLYGASTQTAAAAAPLGVGLGGFQSAFTAHRPDSLPYAPRYAHSELLHGLVEFGLPFLLLIAVTAIAVVRAVPRRFDASRHPIWAAGIALIALVAHALIDFSLHVPAVALMAACIGGCGLATTCVESRPVWTRRVLAGMSACLVALAGTAGVALYAEGEADAYMAAGDFEASESAARWGLAARPGRSDLLTRIADAAEHAAELGGGGPPATLRTLTARAAAATSSPLRSDLQRRSFESLLRAGRHELALLAIERALELDPAAPGIHVDHARGLFALGRQDAGVLALQEAISRYPVAALPTLDALLRTTDDPSLTRSAVPHISKAMVTAGRVLASAGYHFEAAAEFERALELAPADARLAVETARSLRRAGQVERAVVVLSDTLSLAPGDSRLVRELERLTADRRDRPARRTGDASSRSAT